MCLCLYVSILWIILSLFCMYTHAWMHRYTYKYKNTTVKLPFNWLHFPVDSKAVFNVFSLHSVNKHFSFLKITLNSFSSLFNPLGTTVECFALSCVLAYELGDKFLLLSHAPLFQSLFKLCFPCLALLRGPFWTRSTTVLQPLKSSTWRSLLFFTMVILIQQHLKENFNS